DPKHLAGLFVARLETVDPGLGVEDMILALFAVEKLSAEQTGLGGMSGEAAEGIAPLLDRLGARLGLDALSRLEARESHIPERASVHVPVDGSPHPNPPPHAGEGAVRAHANRNPLSPGEQGPHR